MDGHLPTRLHDFIHTVAVVLIVSRPFAKLANYWLEKYILKIVSPGQFVTLVKGGNAAFKIIDFLVHTVISISPAVINGALECYKIGDRDLKIQLPYPAASPGMPNTPEEIDMQNRMRSGGAHDVQQQSH